MRQICDELLDVGLIDEYEGPWGLPAFLVKNNDGTWRMVIDYSRINKQTVDLSYPCPDLNEVLLGFHGKRIFSEFDITKAFYNIKVKDEHKERTAFVTPFGSYTWNVMPFGGKLAPPKWAQGSDKVFRGCPDLSKYVDDLAVASKTESEHLLALQTFFARLAKHNLKVKLSKCRFFQDEITFVGHQISEQGIRPNQKYLTKTVALKRPTNKKEVWSKR